MTKKIRKIYNKVKLNERYRIDDKSKSYRISIKKYVSLTLKGMTPSENSFGQVNFRFKKERITEARYGSDAVLYNKKTAKKEGDYFYKCPAFYKGEKKNGKANGWGVEALRGLSVSLPSHTLHTIIQFYEGEWKNDTRYGKGKIILTEGSSISGFFNHTTIEGEAILKMSNGETIKGKYEDLIKKIK